jgi:PKD repeat protein
MRIEQALVLAALVAALSCGGPDGPPPEAPPGDDDDSAEEPTPSELTAVIEVDRTEGPLPFLVQFDSDASITPEEITEAQWSFGENGQTATGRQTSFTYLASGTHTVTLTLTDAAGGTHATTTTLLVHPGSCPDILGFVQTGTLGDPQLDRASGLAASRANPGVLWSHNDGDQPARLFALGTTGAELATFVLPDALNSDWEDIALGVNPLSGESTIFVADAGDDAVNRQEFSVYMLAEPTAEAIGDAEGETELAWSDLTLAYPDGAALNSETLMFDPQSGALLVVSRDPGGGTTSLFRKAAPHVPGSFTELEFLRTLDLFDTEGSPKGGSISPWGDRILMRTRTAAFLWTRDARQSLAAAFDGPVCPVPVQDAPDGEAIEFSADGAGFYTTSRSPSAPVWYTAFVPPPEPCDGLEARFVFSPVLALQVPVEVEFAVDPTCIPEGLASVEWTIDGQTTPDLEPSVSFVRSGVVEIELTVVDDAGGTDSRTGSIELLPEACPGVGETQEWGTVQFEEINEASGLAASTRNPGVLWVHNDSGDTARLFAMTQTGTHLGIWNLPESPRDYEGMAYGWDETLGTEVLYVGDVGDNTRVRESITIYLVPEPDVDLEGAPVDVQLEVVAAMELTYPDGQGHNCETVLRDPWNGDLYLVTKSSSGTVVYRKPAPHVEGTTELEWVTELDFTEPPFSGSSVATGGDISPSGRRIILRTYTHAWLWIREEGQSVADAFAGPVCDVQAPVEGQGETAAFSPDGAGYITVSEGVAQPIHYTPFVP